MLTSTAINHRKIQVGLYGGVSTMSKTGSAWFNWYRIEMINRRLLILFAFYSVYFWAHKLSRPCVKITMPQQISSKELAMATEQ